LFGEILYAVNVPDLFGPCFFLSFPRIDRVITLDFSIKIPPLKFSIEFLYKLGTGNQGVTGLKRAELNTFQIKYIEYSAYQVGISQHLVPPRNLGYIADILILTALLLFLKPANL
jgi:hypothetical protein